MNFKKHFNTCQVPEWRSAYLNYDFLNGILQPFKQISNMRTPQELVISNIRNVECIEIPQHLQSRVMLLEEEFITVFEEEISKCNEFYLLQADIITNQVDIANDIQSSLQILYEKCTLLKQYRRMNVQAAQRLISKYEEYTSYLDNSSKHLAGYLNDMKFIQDRSVNKVIDNILNQYDDYEWDCSALKHQKQQNTTLYPKLFGVYMGVSIFMMFSIIYQKIEIADKQVKSDHVVFHLFIPLIIILLYFWMMALNIHVWKSHYINYIQILKYQYHNNSIYTILRKLSFFSMILMIILVLTLQEEQQQAAELANKQYYSPLGNLIILPPAYCPLLIWGILLIVMLWPLNQLDLQDRIHFWKLQLQTMSGYYINYTIIWNCEQWLSLCAFFELLYVSTCYYLGFEFESIHQEYIILLPILYRLYFAIRQFSILVILKCIFTISIVICGFITQSHLLWLLIVPITIFNAYVDIKCDWDLLNQEYLRNSLGYHKYCYYLAMIANPILIMSWLSSLTYDIDYDLLLALTILELFRRFIWNCITIEKEHVVNVGEFKAVPELPILDESLILKQKQLYQRLEIQSKHEIILRGKANSLQLLIGKIDKPGQI